MPNHWLRLWHDMPNDPKWRTISRLSGRPVSEVLSVYLHYLVSASTNERRGCVSVDPEDVASALDIALQSVTDIVTAFQGRVLDEDRVSGWEKRQPMREDNSAERVKKWRERDVTQRNAQDKDKEEIKSNTNTPRKTPSKASPSPECLSLYQAYPRHVAPDTAYRAIAKALARKPFAELLAAVSRFATQCRKEQTEVQFIPHPASWFNAGRYDDEAPLLAGRVKTQYELNTEAQLEERRQAMRAAGVQ